MNEYDVKRLAEVLAIQAEIEGMKASNQQQVLANESIIHCEHEFQEKAEELRILASIRNDQL